jgi:nucleoside-diphosphate-sugar epimerase
MMTRDSILVTGAGGFVGRHVLTALRREGVPTIEVEHRWETLEELDRLVGGRAVTGCIHLGWYAHPKDYLRAVEPNVRSMFQTLELAGWLGVRACSTLVIAGSSAEYAPSDQPVTESDEVSPTTVYGSAKSFCHHLLRTTHRPQDLPVTWARIFNVIGPGEHQGRIIPLAVRALLDGTAIDLSPGSQVRDYIDVRDVADALVRLAATRYEGAVNVSTGIGRTLRSVLEALSDHAGDPGLLRFGTRDFAPGENLYVVGDNTLLQSVTGWGPQHPIEDTAEEIVRWWREHR